jgi:hypothetical protein
MRHINSDGEVYGSKMLTLAVIAASAFILAGTVYSPSQPHAQANPAPAQQIVNTIHTAGAGYLADAAPVRSGDPRVAVGF